MPRSQYEVGWIRSIAQAYYEAYAEGGYVFVHRDVPGVGEHTPGMTCVCSPTAYDPSRVSLLDVMRAWDQNATTH